MNTTKVKLTQVSINNANPRTITDSKFQKLINSLLALPKMLELRPIVVDDTNVALGGNMRYRALIAIADMNDDELTSRIYGIPDVRKKTKGEQETLVSYWLAWKDNPTVPVIKASELSDAEKKEFIIKDNVAYGDWDYDALANQWDSVDLNSWGLDVWAPDAAVFGGSSSARNNGGSDGVMPSEPLPNEDSLPDELQGIDLDPDSLPKITGDDKTPMERVIIVFPKEQSELVASMLGLEKIEKIIYPLDELGVTCAE